MLCVTWAVRLLPFFFSEMVFLNPVQARLVGHPITGQDIYPSAERKKSSVQTQTFHWFDSSQVRAWNADC